jgi:hypothetical protein
LLAIATNEIGIAAVFSGRENYIVGSAGNFTNLSYGFGASIDNQILKEVSKVNF